MRRLMIVLPVLCLAALAWALLSPEAQSTGPRSGRLDGLTVGPPQRYANLAIFPVLSREPRDQDRFITLDEGLAAGTVEIFEVGADGSRVAPQREPAPQADANVRAQAAPALNREPADDEMDLDAGPEVNRLMVVNRSGKPLYLMPGEVIVGGQQDRTIAEETILASTGEPTPIDVFCVEHGRWSGRDEQEGAGILAALVNPRGQADTEAQYETTLSLVSDANRGKFVATAGSLNKASRLAAQADRDQTAVWDAVARSNAAAGVSPDSGTFTQNYVDAENRQRLEPYLENLLPRIGEQPQVVGVVVAINGKIEAVDVFESTPLFRKLWPKLLKSYALDAAVAAEGRGRQSGPGVAAARRFLATAFSADVKDESRGQGGILVQQRAADGVISFSVEMPADAAAPAGLGGLGGGFGPVHASAFSR